MPAYDPAFSRRTLFDALIDARDRFGGKRVVLEDQDRKPLTYTGLIRASFALGRKIAGLTKPRERVGVLLPTSMGGAVTFFALQAIGRTPVMLNFTGGSRNLKAACAAAGVKRILSSRRFTAQARLDDVVADLGETVEFTWLEDVRRSIGPADKAFALAASAFARRFRTGGDPDSVGVILFTSGSFGTPKGVGLSHANILANVAQVFGHIAVDTEWVWFNPLPIFHSFGLTAGLVLPLVEGLRSFQYPSPLHYKIIPSLVAETGADVLLSTDTFVNQYARSSEAQELSALKFIVCGAERVKPETHALVADRFGITLVEGYGVTECSPVIAVNLPDDNRPGTVGKLVPRIEARVESVEGIREGGRLLIKGPNVMLGYLNPEGGFDAPADGWYDTGDVVAIDGEGWVRILGRAKRFAKIGGEMVSLAAVEQLAAGAWPGGRHAVVCISDPKKGERLVLITDQGHATPADFLAHAKSTGAPEIAVPRKVIKVHELPVLGTGKTDYVSLQHIAEVESRNS
jgi:acyl-[acyl-carrier-protein]-phospholipid O-acyltransferase/long-chain-fatty-acid--[acyl-carrier-protein] ligase